MYDIIVLNFVSYFCGTFSTLTVNMLSSILTANMLLYTGQFPQCWTTLCIAELDSIWHLVMVSFCPIKKILGFLGHIQWYSELTADVHSGITTRGVQGVTMVPGINRRSTMCTTLSGLILGPLIILLCHYIQCASILLGILKINTQKDYWSVFFLAVSLSTLVIKVTMATQNESKNCSFLILCQSL